MDREAEIKMLIAEIMHRNAGRLRGHKVFLFGSRAAGNAKSHSDFDIGVMGDAPLSMKRFL